MTREDVIAKAREKYIATGVTKNITIALEMFLKNDALVDELIPLFITSPEINQLSKILEEIRPSCDECGSELYFQTGGVDPEGKKWPTSWYCKNCETVYYSDKTPTDWLIVLQYEARNQKLHEPNEPNPGTLPA